MRKAHDAGRNHLRNVTDYYQGLLTQPDFVAPPTATQQDIFAAMVPPPSPFTAAPQFKKHKMEYPYRVSKGHHSSNNNNRSNYHNAQSAHKTTAIGQERAQQVINDITNAYQTEGLQPGPNLFGTPQNPPMFGGMPGQFAPSPFGFVPPGAAGTPPNVAGRGMMPPPPGGRGASVGPPMPAGMPFPPPPGAFPGLPPPPAGMPGFPPPQFGQGVAGLPGAAGSPPQGMPFPPPFPPNGPAGPAGRPPGM